MAENRRHEIRSYSLAMTKVCSLPVVIVTLALGVVACDFQRSGSTSSPSGVPSTGPSSATGSLLGTWASGAPAGAGALPDPKSCSNFQWTITSQTQSTVSGDFSAACAGAITIQGVAQGQLNGTTIPLTVTGAATLPGIGSCNFSLAGTAFIENGNALRIPYSGTTCIGPLSGEETLRRPTPAATPTPTPEPAPPPPPPPPAPEPAPAPSADEIDLNQVTIVLGPNVNTWPQTSTVTATQQTDHNLCIWHTALGQWPYTLFFDDPSTTVEGNQWVFANIGGRWYGGAADWYRPGQACKDVTAQTIGRDAFYNPSQEPLHSWVPRPGEVFGLMDSTPARAWPAMRTLDQRTNVVLVRWNGS
jgi:hypothetical protein